LAKVLFVSEDMKKTKQFKEILEKNSHEFFSADNQLAAFDFIKGFTPDIIILDTQVKGFDLKAVNKKIKSYGDNVLTILLVGEETIEQELSKSANAFLQEAVSGDLLISTINANLRTKNSLEMLSSSNQELARSLYQLNVLYNTSSQFAGTLDKNRLLDIMVEGMDKSLSFGLSCALTFRSENEPVLIITSLYQISDRLLEALKLRTILNYKSLFKKNEIPFELNLENLKIEKHIKQSNKEFDFSVLRYDNMFTPINMSENFFGFIEIYRESEFTTEDATCFQTLAQQVSLPLKSASLYEEIKKTNQKLERLERLKSEFISIVSHELRTPLTAIKNALDILLSGKTGALTEAMDNFINMAKRNVVRLSGIINDLLDLSKIEAGKMDFKFLNTKIEPVLEYVKTSLNEVAKEKKLVLKTKIEDNSTDIYADAQRLEQVLTNLISNAIKFTPEGGEIEIGTKIVDAKEIKYNSIFESELKNLSGKYLMVSVKDTGIGIAQDDLGHVFDQFAQIENSLSRKVGGSGLGLPIARQLMDAHNGAIWCESELEKGSVFYFVIPVAEGKNNFLLNLKQTIQKSKVKNSPVAIINIKGEKEIIDRILEEKNLINKNYLNNSVIEIEDNSTVLSMIISDGDKFSADFLKKKLQGYIHSISGIYPNCAIMYSYAVSPQDSTDEWELIKKVQESYVNIRE